MLLDCQHSFGDLRSGAGTLIEQVETQCKPNNPTVNRINVEPPFPASSTSSVRSATIFDGVSMSFLVAHYFQSLSIEVLSLPTTHRNLDPIDPLIDSELHLEQF